MKIRQTKPTKTVLLVLSVVMIISALTACSDNSEGENPLERCVVSRRQEESTKKSKEDKAAKQEAGEDSAYSQSDLPDVAEFTAETLDGGTITQEEFAKHDLTVINMWQTTCPPCIDEMPELGKLAASLPERVLFINWCLDGDHEKETAARIIKESDFQNATILKSDGDMLRLGRALMYTPTTVAFDSDGRVVGDPLIGAQKDTQKDYTDYINQSLELIGKETL